MHQLSQEQLTQITSQLYSQLPGVPPLPVSNGLGASLPAPQFGVGSPGIAPSPTTVSSPGGLPIPGHLPSPLQRPPQPQQIPSLPSGVNQFTPTSSHPAPYVPATHGAAAPSHSSSPPSPARFPTPASPPQVPTTQFPFTGSLPGFSLPGFSTSGLELGDPLPLVTQLLSSAGKGIADREAARTASTTLPWSVNPQTSAKTTELPPTSPQPGTFQPDTVTTGSGGEGLRNFVSTTQGSHLSKGGLSHDVRRNGDGSQRIFDGEAPLQERSRSFDVVSIRRDFPILHQEVHGKPLVWLDNAATTQKPQCVIDAIADFYARDNSNIHRAAHTLAARATDAYEGARQKVQQFLGAGSPSEIIFVRGTTEGINLVAQTCGRKFLQPGDEILLTVLEHHANIVPWQLVAKETGAVIRVAPVNDAGEIILEEYERLLGSRTRLAAFPHANNSLGTLLPVETLTKMAKRYGARVLIDGAQSVAHVPVNVQSLDCDFYIFSGHKIFGPTGIGAVYAKEELQQMMPPWQGGGSMIKDVTFEETVYSDPPAKFEAGTPNIADAVGLGAALDYVNRLGLPNIARYEHTLLEYATERLASINGLRLVGTAREKVGVLSFVLQNRSTAEIGKLLDAEGIAVRSGHHCAQPSLRRMGLETTVRPSLSIYNTTDEIDHLVASVKRIAQRSPTRF